MTIQEKIKELQEMLARTEDDDTIAAICEAIKYNERKLKNEKGKTTEEEA